MPDEGASWWKSLTLPVSNSVTGKDSCTQTKHYILLETFAQNARKAEILRISWSDGKKALEGTYSHDEVFLGSRRTTGKVRDLSNEMKAIVDNGEDGEIHVSTTDRFEDPHGLAIHICSDILKVRLEMKIEIDNEQFVDRVMAYLNHVEALLRSEQERLHARHERYNLLRKEVNDLMNKKVSEDHKAEVGIRVLMREKKQYWKKGPAFTPR